MKVCLLDAPISERYYTEVEQECWRLLHIYRYQLQFEGKIKVEDYCSFGFTAKQNCGLLSICSALESAGYAPNYCCSASPHEIDISFLSSHDVLGISSITATYPHAYEIANAVKNINPHCFIVIGGHHAPHFPEEILSDLNSPFDAIIRGAGEYTFVKLVQNLEKYGCTPLSSGLILHQRHHQQPNNYSSWAKISAESINMPSYHLVNGNMFSARVYTSYGCPFKCSFCNLGSQSGYISKSVDTLKKELIWLKENKKTKFIYIGDPTFVAKDKRLDDICQIMQDYGLFWQCQTRADLVDEKMLDILSKYSNFLGLEIGVEAMDENILKSVGKDISPRVVQKAIDLAKKYEISTLAYWIFGLPGTNAHIAKIEREKIKDFLDMGVLVHLNMFVPYPGTNYYNNLHAHGIILESTNWLDYYSGGIPVFSLRDMNKAEIITEYNKTLELMILSLKNAINPHLYKSFQDFKCITVYRGLF